MNAGMKRFRMLKTPSLKLRAVALALRALSLRAFLEVSRYRAHAPRALALRVVFGRLKFSV
jgi:hypothetical protein